VILFALSSGKYWIFLDISPRGRSGDHFRSKELTFKLSLAIMKRWRNSLQDRGRLRLGVARQAEGKKPEKPEAEKKRHDILPAP